MSPLSLALIIFACIFAGALLGLFLRDRLPDHHLRDDSRDVVKLGAGLVATLVALVLGLLISSAKNTLDTMNAELTQAGTLIIELDRTLANYGPEAQETRDLLRQLVEANLVKLKSRESGRGGPASIAQATVMIERLQNTIRKLAPRDEPRRQLQEHALKVTGDIIHARWMILEQAQSSLPKPFLVILLFWLTMLFVCFGMLASYNPTVTAALFITALSVAAAIFLILEMNTPISGIINVSSAPLQGALDQLGK